MILCFDELRSIAIGDGPKYALRSLEVDISYYRDQKRETMSIYMRAPYIDTLLSR